MKTMNKLTVFLYFLMLVTLSSCGNSSLEETPQSNTPEVTQTDDRHHNHENEVIELDNGKKWEVNVEMKPFIENGRKLVYDYVNSNDTDYKSLATNLEKENEQLVNSCTMDGQSHDELHKWLHPHLELVSELSNATADKSSEIIKKIEKSYEKYQEYFQ